MAPLAGGVLMIESYEEAGQEGWTWFQIREARAAEFARTDWWALKDLTMSQSKKDYRKFLRDLPQTYSDPDAAAAAWIAYEIPE